MSVLSKEKNTTFLWFCKKSSIHLSAKKTWEVEEEDTFIHDSTKKMLTLEGKVFILAFMMIIFKADYYRLPISNEAMVNFRELNHVTQAYSYCRQHFEL